jgi:hypothetical protein
LQYGGGHGTGVHLRDGRMITSMMSGPGALHHASIEQFIALVDA